MSIALDNKAHPSSPSLITEFWNLTKSLPPRARQELADYSITAAESCEAAPSEFYQIMRRAVENQKIPGLCVSEVLHSESGFGSAQRVYLRLAREKIHFDVCAAPFGTSYFFSYRAVVKTPLPTWLLAALLLLATIVLTVPLIYLANLIFVLRVAICVGPVVSIAVFLLGLIRLHQSRAETFYKLDTGAMFLSLVRKAYEDSVAEIAKDKGIQLRWRVTDPSMINRSTHGPL